MIHFKLIVLCRVRQGLNFLCLKTKFVFASTTYRKDFSLPRPSNGLDTLVKNQLTVQVLTIYAWVNFWTFFSVLSSNLSLLLPIPYPVGSAALYWTWQYEIFNFFLFFKTVLAILTPLHFHINLEIMCQYH